MVKSQKVFQLEIWAIDMAANWLLEKEVKNCSIQFYVDSQAALGAMEAIHSDKITVNRARVAVRDLSFLNTVKLTWVKAHRKGTNEASAANEMADAAARKATKIDPEGSIVALLALAGAKAQIKAKFWNECGCGTPKPDNHITSWMVLPPSLT